MEKRDEGNQQHFIQTFILRMELKIFVNCLAP